MDELETHSLTLSCLYKGPPHLCAKGWFRAKLRSHARPGYLWDTVYKCSTLCHLVTSIFDRLLHLIGNLTTDLHQNIKYLSEREIQRGKREHMAIKCAQ